MGLNTLSLAILTLIKRYVKRQEIPLTVLNSLRPDLVLFTQGAPIELVFEMIEKYGGGKVPQSGRWGSEEEWEYYIHGAGCLVTHSQTGEPIDCDAPDHHRFDKYSFLIWLNWLFINEERNENIGVIKEELNKSDKTLEALVSFILEELEEAHKLRCLIKSKNMYKLIDY